MSAMFLSLPVKAYLDRRSSFFEEVSQGLAHAFGGRERVLAFHRGKFYK